MVEELQNLEEAIIISEEDKNDRQHDEVNNSLLTDETADKDAAKNYAIERLARNVGANTKPAVAKRELSPTDLERREMTEQLLAEKNVKFCYNPDNDRFYLFNGLIWQPDEKGMAMREAVMIVFQQRYEALKNQNANVQTIKKAAEYCTISIANMLIKLLKQKQCHQVTEFDRFNDEIVVANGCINLREGTIGDVIPEHYQSRKIDVQYKNDAFAKSKFGQVLEEIFTYRGDDGQQLVDYEKINFLQLFFGYCLTGETCGQMLLMLYGGGANGKSLLINAINNVFGELGGVVPFSDIISRDGFKNTYSLAAVKNSRLVALSESNCDDVLDEGLIKQLTGGGDVVLRQIYQEPERIKARFKFVMDLNHIPHVSGDYAILRRIVVVEFPRRFMPEEIDPNLENILSTESEKKAILEWLVIGAHRYYGEYGGKIKVPENIAAYSQKVLIKKASPEKFIEEMIELAVGKDVMFSEIKVVYKEFCESNEYPYESEKALSQALENAGFNKKRKSSGICFGNIALKQVNK